MKKIALVVSSLNLLIDTDEYIGGGSVVLRNLISNWRQDPAVILDIYCSHDGIKECEGINKIIKVKASQYNNIHTFVKKLKPYIDAEDYDFILFGEVLAPVESCMFQTHSYPYRYGLYGGGLRTFVERFFGKSKLKRQAERFSSENKKYVAMSEKIRQDYSKYYDIPLENIIVAYPGVNIPEDTVKTASDNDVTFGIVAGSNLNKGAYRFLIALSKLKSNNKNIKGVMVCKNYEKIVYLKFLVNILGLKDNLTVVSDEPEMNEFYKSIDCLVVPSLHDAFALVVLEACSNKTISLVSSNVGASELLTEGENGFIFDMNNNQIENLTSKMQEIIKIKRNSLDDFNQLQENAFDLAKGYTWQKFADKIKESL